MAEEVTIREDLPIIQVDHQGELTKSELMDTLEAVDTINREKGISDVLINAVKLQKLPSITITYNFGSELVSKVMHMKFAIVMQPELREELEFLVNVIQNRGGQVQLFDSEEAALDWLT